MASKIRSLIGIFAQRVVQWAAQSEDDPFVSVLQGALGHRTGKLRVSDAYLVCGIEPCQTSQEQIARFGRAIRAAGWERRRCRLSDGSLQYAYVKGTPAEREIELIVEYDPNLRRIQFMTPASKRWVKRA